MKESLIAEIEQGMLPFLDNGQMAELQKVLKLCLHHVKVTENEEEPQNGKENEKNRSGKNLKHKYLLKIEVIARKRNVE